MNFRKIALAATAITSAVIGPALAGGPSAHKIDLGSFNGVAYYTKEGGRFRVVATLAQQDGQPVRVESVLAPGQSFVLSTPHEGETGPTSVEISREANELLVHTVAVTD